MSSPIASIDQLTTNSAEFVGAEFSSINEVRQSLFPLPLKGIALATMMLWIGCISIYDVYWSFKTQAVLWEVEQNPMGVWLIEMDGGDIALFMTCKMLGTMIVLMSIPVMFVFRKSWGFAAGGAIALFQLWLFCYLNS